MCLYRPLPLPSPPRPPSASLRGSLLTPLCCLAATAVVSPPSAAAVSQRLRARRLHPPTTPSPPPPPADRTSSFDERTKPLPLTACTSETILGGPCPSPTACPSLPPAQTPHPYPPNHTSSALASRIWILGGSSSCPDQGHCPGRSLSSSVAGVQATPPTQLALSLPLSQPKRPV